jgi:hypothetical protein
MSRGLSSRNVALCDQILAVLADEAPLPVTTGHVWRKISPYRPRADRLAALARGEYVPPEVPYSCVLNMLNWLARHQAVEKITLPDKRSRHWRRWPDPGLVLAAQSRVKATKMTDEPAYLDIGPLTGAELLAALLHAIGRAAEQSTIITDGTRHLAVITPSLQETPRLTAEAHDRATRIVSRLRPHLLADPEFDGGDRILLGLNAANGDAGLGVSNYPAGRAGAQRLMQDLVDHAAAIMKEAGIQPRGSRRQYGPPRWS